MDAAAAALGAAPGPGVPPPGAAAGEQQAAPRVERLSAGVQQQLNLEGMRARAVGLYKAISRILEDFDVIARTNPTASRLMSTGILGFSYGISAGVVSLRDC